MRYKYWQLSLQKVYTTLDYDDVRIAKCLNHIEERLYFEFIWLIIQKRWKVSKKTSSWTNTQNQSRWNTLLHGNLCNFGKLRMQVCYMYWTTSSALNELSIRTDALAKFRRHTYIEQAFVYIQKQINIQQCSRKSVHANVKVRSCMHTIDLSSSQIKITCTYLAWTFTIKCQHTVTVGWCYIVIAS
jgi:hypothetical protein